MDTTIAFKPYRLLGGLLGVSVICLVLALRFWSVPGPSHYFLHLILPTLGYAVVLWWSRIFAALSTVQRLLISVLFAPLLGLAFMFVVIALRFTFYAG